jgi:hypothetical protein
MNKYKQTSYKMEFAFKLKQIRIAPTEQWPISS